MGRGIDQRAGAVVGFGEHCAVPYQHRADRNLVEELGRAGLRQGKSHETFVCVDRLGIDRCCVGRVHGLSFACLRAVRVVRFGCESGRSEAGTRPTDPSRELVHPSGLEPLTF